MANEFQFLEDARRQLEADTIEAEVSKDILTLKCCWHDDWYACTFDLHRVGGSVLSFVDDFISYALFAYHHKGF